MEKNGYKKLLRNFHCHDAIFVSCCSLALLIYSLYHHYFARNTSEWKTSPYLFPTLISVFGFLLAFSLLMDALHELQTPEETEKPTGEQKLTGVFVVIGISLFYYLVMPLLTFVPSTLLFLLALFIYLGERKWWKLLLLSGATTAAIYVLFGIMLNVRLP
ncbi:MAG TPA: tripartite tricarboxylate transporter TctB family protein [Clostridia bacterium]|nr:tripartite tricarboxylate transporter TctB family protein [Clostridia bacterium]